MKMKMLLEVMMLYIELLLTYLSEENLLQRESERERVSPKLAKACVSVQFLLYSRLEKNSNNKYRVLFTITISITDLLLLI